MTMLCKLIDDERWRRVLFTAAMPVLTEWREAGKRLVAMPRADYDSMLARYSGRVVCVAIQLDENPTLALDYSISGACITIHKAKRLIELVPAVCDARTYDAILKGACR